MAPQRVSRISIIAINSIIVLLGCAVPEFSCVDGEFSVQVDEKFPSSQQIAITSSNGVSKTFSVPLNDNSTLSRALALARQFLVTSQNVELFKRSQDGDERGADGKSDKAKNMYSWWTKKPSLTEGLPPTEAVEYEEETTDVPEPTTSTPTPTTTTTTVSTTVLPDSPKTTALTSGLDVHLEEEKTTMAAKPKTSTTSVSPTTSTMKITTTSVAEKKTRRTRPTKRPIATNRPPPTTTTVSIITAKDSVEESPTSSTNNGGGPLGVKRKFIEIAKHVASSTADRVAPIAKDAARQAGILALTISGHLGNLTKNAAESTYVNLAKRLNATELLNGNGTLSKSNSSSSSSSSSTTRSPHNTELDLKLPLHHEGSGPDDESCAAAKGFSSVTLILTINLFCAIAFI